MRTADSFKINEDKEIDEFIEKYIYTKLDEGEHPVVIYENFIQQEYINSKVLEKRLKELKFKVNKNVLGTDSVIEIRIK